MARQRPTPIPTLYIDRIVIREVQYQLEVNRCRNEEVMVKGSFGWVWPMWEGAPGLVMGPCIHRKKPRRERVFWGKPIDCIVIREVQYQLEVNRCRNEEIIVKGNFGWVWPMWAGRPRIDRIVIREVHYQFEVNRCRNEEIILKVNFGWVWSMWAGRPRVGNGAMHRNEEIIVKGNFGWAWSMWAGAPGLVMRPCIVEIDHIVIRDVQFEVNRCRNEEVNFQGSSTYSVGGDSGFAIGRTDRRLR
ncbi:hypothetical protein DPMN_165149 [Dreissena polymorpha]|uniref:Uncharacterized protein n=1 Tax=Dreissena polymorpha TaxID=45954 RepID=A0A9D4EUU5_DREPO|nr:hypothetical protein DPMN_165149 [Dreissena polymorpha]